MTGTKVILKAQNESRIESILYKIDEERDKFYFYKGDDFQLKTQVDLLNRKSIVRDHQTMIVSLILKERTHIDKLTKTFNSLSIGILLLPFSYFCIC